MLENINVFNIKTNKLHLIFTKLTNGKKKKILHILLLKHGKCFYHPSVRYQDLFALPLPLAR